MNNSKIFTTGCAFALSMVSLGTQAGTRTDGLDACAAAMVSELGSAQGVTMKYSMSPDTETSDVRLKRREVFHMDIRDPATREIIARADCTVDEKAKVRKLESVPLDAEDAVVRAGSSRF
ncbi:hypothetical protein ACFL3I_12220 [Pseudomonadota bacterium]